MTRTEFEELHKNYPWEAVEVFWERLEKLLKGIRKYNIQKEIQDEALGNKQKYYTLDGFGFIDEDMVEANEVVLRIVGENVYASGYVDGDDVRSILTLNYICDDDCNFDKMLKKTRIEQIYKRIYKIFDKRRELNIEQDILDGELKSLGELKI